MIVLVSIIKYIYIYMSNLTYIYYTVFIGILFSVFFFLLFFLENTQKKENQMNIGQEKVEKKVKVWKVSSVLAFLRS